MIRASSSGACATVSSASSRAHGSISPAYCEPISAPGDVPLVDEEERLAACLAARGHASSPTVIVDRRLDPAHRPRASPRPRSCARSASSSSGSPRRDGDRQPDDAGLEVDRPAAPHADPVDALGGARRRSRRARASGTVTVPRSVASTRLMPRPRRSSASVEVE